MATEKLSRLASSQLSTASTNVPVENWQRRTAPTPRPFMVAKMGYATPKRNSHSSGFDIAGKAMRLFQTRSGGALISIPVRTTLSGGSAGFKYSEPIAIGSASTRAPSTTGACLGARDRRWITYPIHPPSIASASARSAMNCTAGSLIASRLLLFSPGTAYVVIPPFASSPQPSFGSSYMPVP